MMSRFTFCPNGFTPKVSGLGFLHRQLRQKERQLAFYLNPLTFKARRLTIYLSRLRFEVSPPTFYLNRLTFLVGTPYLLPEYPPPRRWGVPTFEVG